MPWQPDIAAKSAELYKQRAEPIRRRMPYVCPSNRCELRVKIYGKDGPASLSCVRATRSAGAKRIAESLCQVLIVGSNPAFPPYLGCFL